MASKDDIITPTQLWTLIDEAFTASIKLKTAPLDDRRKRYVRVYAGLLFKALEAKELDTGHMTAPEVVSVLLATALAVQTKHGKKGI